MKKLVTVLDAEELERQYAEDGDELVPTERMLAQAGVQLAHATRPSYLRSDNLERDGSLFILISVALLEKWGCPVAARDFVYIMEGLANGNYADLLTFTDEQISFLSGLSEKTIREKRKALMLWEDEKDSTVIQIIEHDFNKETGKNDPTQYRVVFINHVAEFIRAARNNYSFQKNPIRAIENSESNGLQPLVTEAYNRLEPAPTRKRKRKGLAAPKDDKVELAARCRQSALSSILKWSDCEYQLGRDTDESFNEFIIEASKIVSEAKARFEAKTEGTKPKKWRK